MTDKWPLKHTSSGAEIAWCISHPFDGSQSNEPPEDAPMGICDECEKDGRGAAYIAMLGISGSRARRLRRRRAG